MPNSTWIGVAGFIGRETLLEDGAFIGSNVNLIAPVVVKSNAYICAGTTVDKNVEADEFVIGRVRQESKPQRAKAYLNKNND